MKKLFIMGLVGWLSSLTTSATDWTVANNIANGCTVTVSSNQDNKNIITDGVTNGAYWQANPKAEGNDWVLVDLGEEKKIADIDIMQQTALASQFDVYVLSTKPEINKRETGKDGIEEYTVNLTGLTAAGHYTASAENPTTSIHFNEAIKGQYILFYSTEDSEIAKAYGTALYEILVGEFTDDYNQVKAIRMNNLTINNGETVEAKVTPYTVGGNFATSFEGVDNLTLTVSDPDAAVIENKGNGIFAITGKKFGLFTLTATANINGETVTASATLNIQFAWNSVQNIALNKNAYASHKTENANLSVDGNLDTRWEVGDNIQTGTWYYVDLGELYNITAIAPTWEAAYASHYKYYTATELGADNEPTWEELTEIERTLANAARYTDTYVLPEAKEARYVKIECLKSEVWGMSFWEFQVAGEAAGQIVATEMTLTASDNVLLGGKTCTLSTEVRDNYNNVMDVTPSLSIIEGEGELNGNIFTATAKGNVTIEASYDNLKASVTINVAAVPAEKIGMSGATATADEKTDENNPASNAIDNNGNTMWVTAQGEDAGEADHWIQINLDYAYNLDMVALSWEGASPADYKVYAGADEENLTEIFSRKGQAGMVNYTDLIATDVKNAKVIKVVTTKNATSYGVKLFELEAYGTLAAGQTYTRTVSEGNYGTLCLPFDATVTGATLYTVEGLLNNSAIVLQKVEKAVAGHPYIFRSTSNKLEATYAEGALYTEAMPENGLQGTLKRIEGITDQNNELTGMYMLDARDNTWKRCGTGCSLGANRAYINKENLKNLTQADPNTLLLSIFVEEDPTGIHSIQATDNVRNTVYTLDGRRILSTETLQKGIYIINGKKTIVK